MAELAAGKYARAMFELKLEKGQIDEAYDQICNLKNLLENDDEFRQVLSHPGVRTEQKIEIFINSFKGVFDDDIIGFLTVILKNSRQDTLKDILAEFIGMVRHHKKIVKARVYTAVALSDEQLIALTSSLEARLDKNIEITAELDTSLLTGLKIIVEEMGLVIERSAKRDFDELRKSLLKIQLA